MANGVATKFLHGTVADKLQNQVLDAGNTGLFGLSYLSQQENCSEMYFF